MFLAWSLTSAVGTSAAQEDIFTVRIDDNAKAPPSTQLLKEHSVPAGLVGRACVVTALVGNNESIHVDNDLIVSTGGASVRIPDVEGVPGTVVEAGGTLTLGESVSVTVEIGEDGIFSGGDTSLTFNCARPVDPPSIGPAIGVTISATETLQTPGETATFIVEITNESPDAEPVTLTLLTYNGHSVVSGAQDDAEAFANSDCALVEVEAGTAYTCSFDVEVLGSAGDEGTHTVFVAAQGRLGRPTQASAEHLLVIAPPPPTVIVVLTDDEAEHGPLGCGDRFAYTAAFVNLGSEEARLSASLEVPPELEPEAPTTIEMTVPPGGTKMWEVDVAVQRDVAKPVIARLIVDGQDVTVRGVGSEPTVLEGDGEGADCAAEALGLRSSG